MVIVVRCDFSLACKGKVEHGLGPTVHEREASEQESAHRRLAARFEGNRKAAAHALESVLDTITREVAKGEKVAITGFGSFEKRVRDARWVATRARASGSRPRRPRSRSSARAPS